MTSTMFFVRPFHLKRTCQQVPASIENFQFIGKDISNASQSLNS